MFKSLAIVLVSGFILLESYGAPKENPFALVRLQTEKGSNEAALSELYKIKDEALSKTDREWKYYEMGKISYELGRLETATSYLKSSNLIGKSLIAYRSYILGKISQAEGDRSKARQKFTIALNSKPPRNLVYSIRHALSQLDLAEKKWRSAYRGLRYLDRKWRGKPEHAEVIWNLIDVELKLKRKWRACRWARKVYSTYPTDKLIKEWGIDLHQVNFKGKKLGCLASPSDQRNRIRRLQWSGRSDRAKNEIIELLSRTTAETKYSVDSMLADYNVREGYLDEALKILLIHYEKQKKNFSYLMLLGKAAARAGEYQAAVGSYNSAFRLHPKGRVGRKALFQAAFLSYQFQDYDGAVRKFSQFIKLFPKSGLSRDSLWHISWIQYLKGDYEGAANSFQSILAKKKRYRRRWRKFDKERVQYWLAMSYLKVQKLGRAKEIFLEIAEDRLLGFYSLAAQYRLLSLPGVKMGDVLRLQGVVARGLASPELTSTPKLQTLAYDDGGAVTPKSPTAEEDESEDNIDEVVEERTEENNFGEDDFEIPWLNSNGEKETTSLTKLRGVGLKSRLSRAYGFISLGNYDLAKWELYEIERRTKKTQYLKILMHAYQEVGAYNRSSYVGAINFSGRRKQYGIKGVRYLWEYAYPQAFKVDVEGWAKSFTIHPELIWSIMRAETMFRADAISPVGARGLMQIMPHTGKKIAGLLGDQSYVGSELSVPKLNIKYGSRYLQRLSKQFEGQIPLVAAGYNAGPHRVENWLRRFGDRDMDEFIEHIPFVETRNYVKKVVRHFGIYQMLYGERNLTMAWLAQPVPVRRKGPSPTRESWEAL